MVKKDFWEEQEREREKRRGRRRGEGPNYSLLTLFLQSGFGTSVGISKRKTSQKFVTPLFFSLKITIL